MNTFGDKFRITLLGGSHSDELSVEIEGVPCGLAVSEADFMADITRRQGGGLGKTPRVESDIPKVIRGIENGITTGTTVKLSFENKNIRLGDYAAFADVPRPGHADFTRRVKYGMGSLAQGAGIFSGRMTLPVVAAGVVAKKMIAPISVSAYLVEVGGIKISGPDTLGRFSEEALHENGRRSEQSVSDGQSSGIVSQSLPQEVVRLLERTTAAGDSLGGIVECVCTGVSAGLGEPFFSSVESEISRLAFSIPGVRAVEFGDGFEAARMLGSRHNDPICDASGRTSSNGSGGINGGITNGNHIVFRIAFKPTSSIALEQRTFNFSKGRMEDFRIGGRHDVCFALRTPPVVEAIAAIYLANV